MRLIVFTDIDDTLMHTARKLPSTAGLTLGATTRDGAPSSFMTAKQEVLWNMLAAKADRIIPVTARSRAALARVSLPFGHEAVTDFGATILRADGTRDAQWHQQLLEESSRLRQAEFFESLAASIGNSHGARLLKTELRESDGLPCFVSFRVAQGREQLQHEVERALESAGRVSDYYLHVTDRDVTVLPNFIRKDRAVAHLVAEHGYQNDLTLGLGDSVSDLPFMARCDFMVIPAESRAATAALGQTGDEQ